MAFFPWRDEYSVGVKCLDEQHRSLVGILNRLYEAMQAGEGREALGEVLSSLVDYTKNHFATEESLMRRHGFPEYRHHKAKHEKMTQHVLTLAAKYESGEISNPIQITNFLKDWLGKHILKTDKLYQPFLNDKGVY